MLRQLVVVIASFLRVDPYFILAATSRVNGVSLVLSFSSYP